MIRTIVSGILGRMGTEVTALLLEDNEFSLIGGYDSGNGTAPVTVVSQVNDLPDNFDLVIDFSAPQGALEMVRLCLGKGKSLVTGTTGFTDKEFHEIEGAARNVPILMASNMSMGINAIVAILERMPKPVYDCFDVEIVETHHRMKKDSPSGTAKTIAKVISQLSGKASLIHGREGRGLQRKDDEIGIHAIRGGTVVGTHTIFFHGNGESIEITHRASSRTIFALGALAAAKWIVGQGPGLYSMRDLLS